MFKKNTVVFYAAGFDRIPNRAVGEGLCPSRAVRRCKFDRAHADTHAPVGADASVRPAVRPRKNECTDANAYNICRGRCRALPARCTTDFTKRCDKFAAAQTGGQGRPPLRVRTVSYRCVRGFNVVPPGGASHSPTLRLNNYFFTLHYYLFPQFAPPLLYDENGSAVSQRHGGQHYPPAQFYGADCHFYSVQLRQDLLSEHLRGRAVGEERAVF